MTYLCYAEYTLVTFVTFYGFVKINSDCDTNLIHFKGKYYQTTQGVHRAEQHRVIKKKLKSNISVIKFHRLSTENLYE